MKILKPLMSFNSLGLGEKAISLHLLSMYTFSLEDKGVRMLPRILSIYASEVHGNSSFRR